MRGIGDLDVAFKSGSAENPRVFHTIIMPLKDVLHVPHAAINILSMSAFDDEGCEYVGKDGMISMCGGRLRFLIKDWLSKIQGFRVTRKIRRDLEESENIRACNEFGIESDTDDEQSDQVHQAVVAPAKASPETVDWNSFTRL